MKKIQLKMHSQQKKSYELDEMERYGNMRVIV
jgi:hypothetical protein